MKKMIYLLFIISLSVYCGSKEATVEKIIEDGVEVVLNHIEPYKIKGELSNLILEEEFVLDTEKDEMAELGITDMRGFDVNSEGDIYLFNSPLRKGDMVYKFDREGNFIKSFLQRGQGPGEVQFPSHQRITHQDNLPILDVRQRKLCIFDKDGELLEETRLASDIRIAGGSKCLPLENGNYLIRKLSIDPSFENYYLVLSLYNSEFEEIKELDKYHIPNWEKAHKVDMMFQISLWAVSDGNIYVGNEKKGYEIRVYDLEGNLLRKIRKEYEPVDYPEEEKKAILDEEEGTPGEQEIKKKLVFPEHYPPIQHLFLDDEGRLFVMTYEKGENPEEFMFDIFNPEGIFIGRKSLRVFITLALMEPGGSTDVRVAMRNNRLYCLHEKESGFQELVVYRASWE
ncbi:MAG: 6-bladed beta-propeller [Candidatus Aminicenantes bacterium]|nr:MAG: 6-bladed beta-propeller [Candidatus Aminicenantes bacterium]